MKKLHIEDKVFELPGSMNEMTTDQLISLSKLVALNVPIQEVKVKMLFHCLNAQVRQMKNLDYYRIKIDGNTYALTVENVAAASIAFDYLFTEPDKDGNCFLDNKLTVNHYPILVFKNKTFFGPKDAMTDLLYNQYIYLQTYDVMKEKKPTAIYAWLGCMFREDKNHFNPEELNLDYMKRIDPDVIVLMLWYWIGSCRFIADKFFRVFPETEGGTGSGNPYDGQQKLLDFIGKSDPEKKRAYKKDFLYDILYSLDSILEKEEKETP